MGTEVPVRAARGDARGFAAFWCVQAGQQAGRLAHAGSSGGHHPWENAWLWTSTSIFSVVAPALLPCESTGGEEVYGDFLLRFGERRKDGWSADTCWERGGCGAGEVTFKDWQSSLHGF